MVNDLECSVAAIHTVSRSTLLMRNGWLEASFELATVLNDYDAATSLH